MAKTLSFEFLLNEFEEEVAEENAYLAELSNQFQADLRGGWDENGEHWQCSPEDLKVDPYYAPLFARREVAA